MENCPRHYAFCWTTHAKKYFSFCFETLPVENVIANQWKLFSLPSVAQNSNMGATSVGGSILGPKLANIKHHVHSENQQLFDPNRQRTTDRHKPTYNWVYILLAVSPTAIFCNRFARLQGNKAAIARTGRQIGCSRWHTFCYKLIYSHNRKRAKFVAKKTATTVYFVQRMPMNRFRNKQQVNVAQRVPTRIKSLQLCWVQQQTCFSRF